jgi:hypothetical protein
MLANLAAPRAPRNLSRADVDQTAKTSGMQNTHRQWPWPEVEPMEACCVAPHTYPMPPGAGELAVAAT